MKTSTRAIALVIALLMAFPLFIFQASAKEITVTADGIDVFRETGFLVVYTPAYGASTNTNTWGDEVIIENNKAVRYSMGNSAIPENGFVISGHDDPENGRSRGDWIRQNIKIGDYVYVAPDGVITISNKSLDADIFYTLTTSIRGVNTERDQNTIVVYNQPDTLTGTNEWGYEIICDGGYVTSLGGNNSKVPSAEGSLVVSGHGDKVTWLQNNVKIGMQVTYDAVKKTISFSYNEQSAIMGMKIYVDGLWDKYNTAIARYDNFDYTSAKAEIEKLEDKIDAAKSAYEKDGDARALANASKAIEEEATQVALTISESPTVEYRGVWVRPNETSKQQVEDLIEKLHKNGINTVCVETLLNCTMIMPMPEDSLFEQDPVLKANNVDLLQAYIDACHERGMELHVWMPVFYVGDKGSANISRSVGMKKPEWRSMSSNGSVDENGGYVMIDPGNEEVKSFLLDSYRYILENYDIDGFQLDYIRYFQSTDTYDMGYNRETVAKFFSKYGQQPQYNKNWPLWDEWVQFRCDNVTDFVRRMRALIDEIRPDVLLGADVVPDPTESKSLNYQDYFLWLDEGLLDIVFPMAYGNGHEEAIRMQVESCGDSAMIAVGLGIFMAEMTPSIMDEQANFNTSANADGSVYFSASQYLSKDTGEFLLKGVYRNSAVTPTYDTKDSTLAKIEYAKSRINNIIKPLGGINEADAKAIVAALDAFGKTLETKDSNGKQQAYDAIKYAWVEKKIKDSAATDQAKERMLDDLESIVKAYSVQSKNGDTYKVPAKVELSDEIIEDLEKEFENMSDGESENKGLSVGWIIAICVALVIVIAASVVVIVFVLKGSKQKEKKND